MLLEASSMYRETRSTGEYLQLRRAVHSSLTINSRRERRKEFLADLVERVTFDAVNQTCQITYRLRSATRVAMASPGGFGPCLSGSHTLSTTGSGCSYDETP